VLHCVLVPVVAGALMIVHFWRIRKDTFSGPPISPQELPHDKVDTWPHLVVREYIGAIGCMIVISLWSLLQKAPLEEMANPSVTPNPSKAPWYFTGLQELLVYFDPWIAGVVLPTVIMIGLMAVPYLDPDKNKGVGRYSFKERPLAMTYFLFGVGMWFFLIFIGSFLRGPNWDIYWPWESWFIHKPPPPQTWSLPLGWGLAAVGGYFIIGMALPRLLKPEFEWKKALLNGLLAILGFASVVKICTHLLWEQMAWLVVFGYVYYLLGVLVPRRHLVNQSKVRYAATMVLVLLMLGVLMKMGVRLGFHIKYILTVPQFQFNI
jgi:hypothetical protein